MSKLALLGGRPVRTKKWKHHQVLGKQEKQAVMKLLNKGMLSYFEGNYFAEKPFSFFGGPNVVRLEKKWAQHYRTKHAVSVNSATSALYASMGALGVGPGDEVIVSPYTMSASACCPLIYGAVPVFADISRDTFNLDPSSIEKKITKRTKAIVVVHLLGHPADMIAIMKIAKKHKLAVIEDCAQAHDASLLGKKVGTFGDIGIFSLNVNKTIQAGEGGILITNNHDLALRLQLIRNHGEVVADQIGYKNVSNIVGYNYRMCEMEAVIIIEQMKRLKTLNRYRMDLAGYLTHELSKFDGITPPVVRKGCKHVYYMYGIRFNEKEVGIKRSLFCKALCAEGIEVFEGYTRPLYLQQLYQKKKGFGGTGFPFKSEFTRKTISYAKGICPVTESLYEKEFIGFEFIKWPNTLYDMKDVVKGFEKVYQHMDELKGEKI